MSRSIFAGRLLVLSKQTAYGAVAWDDKAFGEAPLGEIRLELDNRHRRDGGQVMRVHTVQQMLGEGRKLGINLELNAGRQEGEALQQSLNIWIGAFESIQSQTPRDLGKLLGELPPHLPQMLEFPVVVPQHARVHQLAPRPNSSRTV
jgi:hypothetical protein